MHPAIVASRRQTPNVTLTTVVVRRHARIIQEREQLVAVPAVPPVAAVKTEPAVPVAGPTPSPLNFNRPKPPSEAPKPSEEPKPAAPTPSPLKFRR